MTLRPNSFSICIHTLGLIDSLWQQLLTRDVDNDQTIQKAAIKVKMSVISNSLSALGHVLIEHPKDPE
jgi:hypothetical protein